MDNHRHLFCSSWASVYVTTNYDSQWCPASSITQNFFLSALKRSSKMHSGNLHSCRIHGMRVDIVLEASFQYLIDHDSKSTAPVQALLALLAWLAWLVPSHFMAEHWTLLRIASLAQLAWCDPDQPITCLFDICLTSVCSSPLKSVPTSR